MDENGTTVASNSAAMEQASSDITPTTTALIASLRATRGDPDKAIAWVTALIGHLVTDPLRKQRIKRDAEALDR